MKRLVLTIGTLIALSANAEDPYLADNLTVWLRADLGVTAAGGTWFIVFKTPCPRAERINMGITTWLLHG